MKLLRMVTLLALAAAILAGCETVKGVGRDITALGEGTQRLVNDENR